MRFKSWEVATRISDMIWQLELDQGVVISVPGAACVPSLSHSYLLAFEIARFLLAALFRLMMRVCIRLGKAEEQIEGGKCSPRFTCNHFVMSTNDPNKNDEYESTFAESTFYILSKGRIPTTA